MSLKLKGDPDPSHFIFEINVGTNRIRHTTALKLNDFVYSKSIEGEVIRIQSWFMSDPAL